MGTYDDEQSLGLKYEFAVQHGVGIGICKFSNVVCFRVIAAFPAQ